MTADGMEEYVRKGKMSLVDLAGSERLKMTNSHTGKARRETVRTGKGSERYGTVLEVK